MAFMLKDSPECTKSELELFHIPGTQTVIQNGQWIQFHPLSNVFDGGPVEFLVSGSGEEYMDLSQTLLYVKAKIIKTDGKPTVADSKIGPVNLFLHSLFSQVDVTLNDRLISSSSNTYPYRAYIETLLNHGFDSKTSQLTCEMFYKDTFSKIFTDNEGWIKRSEFFKLSNTIDMIGGIHCDLFHQDRLMLNLVDLKLKLIRSKPEFCLHGNEGHKVVLDHVSLFVRKVRVSPGITLGHAKALEKATAKYPINRVLCKVYSVPQGSMSIVQDNVFVGQMPKRVIVGCVDNDAFHGTYKKSPFEFNHYHLNFIGVYVDGQPVPYNPLEPNFDENNYIRAYQSLFLGREKVSQDHGIFISRDDYPLGYTLYAFDLSPDLCDGEHMNLIKHSNLRLEMKFRAPLSQTISVIVYSEFENIIEINKSRTVIYDFAN
ncbi:uncharacterized protein F54H12.2-like [Stegodyphus dumicola]|uniref:uncharacterized protein F54H12.2-like n=1 Tax=Stegodyphus dumicola TaxID=202533 RepID=UPI0015AB1CAD|nr:uncharacterized protein F54H12.2-like [Stegodyphus dumicola]